MHSRANKSRKNSRCSRNRNNDDIFLDCSLYENIGRIGNPRCSSIGDECNIFSFLQKCDYFLYFHISRVCMKRNERFGNLIMMEKNSRSTRIFTSDDIRFTQSSKCSKSDIFEVSDGCGYDGKRHRRFLIGSF